MRAERGLFIVAMLLATAPASAEPTPHERAADSFQQARAAFARREFTAAAAAFEQAAEYEPHPAAWLNAAEAWEKADEPIKAATDCDRAGADPAATSVHKKEVEACQYRLARRVATVDIAGTGTAAIDGGAPFSLPAVKRLTAGPHVVSFLEANQRASVNARLGETVTAEAKPLAVTAPSGTPAALPTHAEPESRGIPAISIGLFGVGAIGAGATTFFGARTVGARDDFDRSPTSATRDAFYRERLLTNVALGVTAAAVLGAVAIWVFAPSTSKRAAARRPLRVTSPGFAF